MKTKSKDYRHEYENDIRVALDKYKLKEDKHNIQLIAREMLVDFQNGNEEVKAEDVMDRVLLILNAEVDSMTEHLYKICSFQYNPVDKLQK